MLQMRKIPPSGAFFVQLMRRKHLLYTNRKFNFIKVHTSSLFIAALGANALFIERNSAERTTVYFISGYKFFAGGIYSAGERNLCYVEFILQKVVDNFNHTLNGHRLLCYDKTTFGISLGKLRFEGGSLHDVIGCAAPYALLFIHIENGGQKRVVTAKYERVVKIFEHIPSRLLNFVTRENHIHPGFYAILHLDCKNTGVSVQILGLASESVKSVRILQLKPCYASHI